MYYGNCGLADAPRASFPRTSRAANRAVVERATHKSPNDQTLEERNLNEEIDAVIVNGTVIRRENKDQAAADGSLPGKLLRDRRAS